jgi:hypothetical protein
LSNCCSSTTSSPVEPTVRLLENDSAKLLVAALKNKIEAIKKGMIKLNLLFINPVYQNPHVLAVIY